MQRPDLLLTSQPQGWYQIILLGDIGTCVLTTCPGLCSTAHRDPMIQILRYELTRVRIMVAITSKLAQQFHPCKSINVLCKLDTYTCTYIDARTVISTVHTMFGARPLCTTWTTESRNLSVAKLHVHPAAGPTTTVHQDILFQACFPIFIIVCQELAATQTVLINNSVCF